MSSPSSAPADPQLPLDLAQLITPLEFNDRAAAERCLGRMATGSDPAHFLAIWPHLATELQVVAEPDRVLVFLDRLVRSARSANLDLVAELARHPHTIHILVTLFASSQFLTEILLRHPGYATTLTDQREWTRPKSGDEYLLEGRSTVGLPEPGDDAARLNSLRRYQQGELLRIGVCDLLAQFDLPTVTRQLSNLADAMAQVCLEIVTARSGTGQTGFAVMALGKLGGRELNYSSDIDLLFVADRDDPIYRRIGQRLIDALAGITSGGFLYRVDMRLRPWGRSGALVPSLSAYLSYLQNQARLWEKQALLKARFIAGDARLGDLFLREVTPSIYASHPAAVRGEVAGMKQRTEEYLQQRGRGWGEVKLGAGSIRDVEFVVQYLQLIHGLRQPEVRSRRTLSALRRLARFGLLSPPDSRTLANGYIFLRTVEHHLQMMDYRQTYTLPNDPTALHHLARRLGFQGLDDASQFLQQYDSHSAAIRTIYLRYLGDVPMETSEVTPAPTPAARQHIARLDPAYESTFTRADIERHAVLANQLNQDNLVEVDAVALDDDYWRVTIIAYDYPGALSLICGLFFIYNLHIYDGSVFTYEPVQAERGRDSRRKIVDLFTVRAEDAAGPTTWQRYRDDLAALLQRMQVGERQQATLELAKQVAAALHGLQRTPGPLYPIEIEIDNEASPKYTVLRIAAHDTTGFLYELTNALALHKVYIAKVTIDTQAQRVRDDLYVTDDQGRKITDPARQRELRAATSLAKHFTHLLPHSSDPESAMLHFREFVARLFQRPNWPDELASLEQPEVLYALARLLGVSDFLWEDFLRIQHANLFPIVRDVDALRSAKSRAQLQHELEEDLRQVHDGPQPPSDDAPWRKTLNAFKDREMFRIDMRHILGHTLEFWEFAEELTDLAEVVVNCAFHLSSEDLRLVHGQPLQENGLPAEMTVCALGKCGGRELGFASDIELMFIYSGNGKTTGPQVITTAEFFEKVVESFVRAIQAKREGIFEIDLQLRPYGKAGSLAVSLESFRRYYAPEGPAWPYERQALVKLRPIAGDPQLGQKIAAMRDNFVYTGKPFNVTAMRAMRERQIMHLVKGGTFHPKFSPGGLADVEYLLQGLQINHGLGNLRLRTTNTREAMAALHETNILSDEEYLRLRRAHTFLRWLIDSMRVVKGNAKDLALPAEEHEEFLFLARRMRYGEDTTRLREDLIHHTSFVQEINRQLLG